MRTPGKAGSASTKSSRARGVASAPNRIQDFAGAKVNDGPRATTHSAQKMTVARCLAIKNAGAYRFRIGSAHGRVQRCHTADI
jgi:hypothetical protein